MIKVKVTLTDVKGHKVKFKSHTKRAYGYTCISQAITLIDTIPGTNIQFNKRHQTRISLIDIWRHLMT